MQRPWRLLLGWTIVLLVVGAPGAYLRHRESSCRNFHVVRDGVLFRSGQLTLPGLKRILRDYGIRTVVNLRDGDSAPDQAEEQYCLQAGICFVRIPARPWWASDGTVPAEEGLAQFRSLVANANHWPLLVHCFAGHHRTGAYCAVFRIDFDGWSNELALREMKSLGYQTIDGDLDILEYLRAYRPRSSVVP